MCKISVIIPVYNAEKYISPCVESLLEQTFDDFEIIMVNDGSTDKSAEIVDTFSEKYDFISCYHKTNGGAASARNLGLEYAKGEYISFIDADDTVDPHFLEKLFTAAKETNADIAMCDYIKHTVNGSHPFTQPIRDGFYSKSQIEKELFPCLIMFDNLELPPTISNCVCLFKRSLLIENDIRYPEVKLCEDSFFGSAALYNSNGFVYLKNLHLYNYLYRPSSVSHSASKEKMQARWQSLLELNREYEEYFGKTDYDFTLQIKYNMLYFTLNQLMTINSLGAGLKEHRKYVKAIINETRVRNAMRCLKYPAVPFKLKVYIFLVAHRLSFLYCLTHR